MTNAAGNKTGAGTETSVSSDNSFQCILNAATSPATKLEEETLTYLNQGQSYELRIKKLGDLADYSGKLFKVGNLSLNFYTTFRVDVTSVVIYYFFCGVESEFAGKMLE